MAQVSDVLLPELMEWEEDGISAVKKDKSIIQNWVIKKSITD